MIPKFNYCGCSLTDAEIYDDIASVVKLTGSETDGELQMLHESIFHSDAEEYGWDDTDFWGTSTPTVKQLAVEQKDYRRMIQKCAICPPNKGENASRKAKHGNQKKRKVNKKQGRAAKDYSPYDEDKVHNINKAGRRR